MEKQIEREKSRRRYRYGTIAYIGGGFGAGIHNTLEAAVYGIPVLFGPRFQKFKEARDLIKVGGGFSVASKDEFVAKMDETFGTSIFIVTVFYRAILQNLVFLYPN